MSEVSDVREALASLDRRLGEIRQHMVTIQEEVAAHTGESEAEMASPGATGAAADGVTSSMAEPAPPAADGSSSDPGPAADAVAPADSSADREPAAEPEPSAESELRPEPEPPPPAGPPREPEPPLEPWPPGDDAEPLVHAEPGAEVERLQQLCERLLESAREIDALRRVASESRASRVVFEGEVTLVVRGVDRLQTLLALEEGLQNRPGIKQAVVSAYVPGEARMQLTLTRPMELAAELDRVLPFTHSLRASSCMGLVVCLGTEPLDT